MGFTIIAETVEAMKQLVQRERGITLTTMVTEPVTHLTGDKNGRLQRNITIH